MGLLSKWKNRSRGGLIENTVMLAIMEFSNLALGFITSGYQYQVLQKDNAGLLAHILYIMNFFQLFMDFGFIQSAPGKIARRKDDKAFLSKMMTCVTLIKLIFLGISSIVLFTALGVTEISGFEYLTYWLCLLQVATNSLLPDFMYRGMEKMSVIAVRTICIKAFSVVMILLFVKQPGDFYLVPLFTIIANVAAMVFVYTHLLHKMKIPFCKVSFSDIWTEIKDSSHFFLSRIASTTYTSVNGVIISSIGANGYGDTAAYNRADVVIGAAKKGLLSPVADSMYPHMMRTRNFSIIKKTLKWTLPVLIVGCAGVFIFAEPLLTLWLGPEGVDAVLPLRALMPTVIVTLPSYILGFPTLGAMGLSNKVNNSTVFGTILHVILLAITYFTGNMSVLSLCILTCITETFILIYRAVTVYRNRHLMYEIPEDKVTSEDEKEALNLIADDLTDEAETK